MNTKYYNELTESAAPKDINPKDAIGAAKVPMSCVPANVLSEIGTALYEGSRKYGRHNQRVAPVKASIYYDAALRHLFAWWEGEDIDKDSGINHITKSITGLIVLRDAIYNASWVDDRPPSSKSGFIQELNDKIKDIQTKYPNPREPYTEK